MRRVLKFVKEEYNTALEANLNSAEPSGSQTPTSFAQTPAGIASSKSNTDGPEYFAHAWRKQSSADLATPFPSSPRSNSLSNSGLNSPTTASAFSAPAAAPTIFDLLGHKGPIMLTSNSTSESRQAATPGSSSPILPSALDNRLPLHTPSISPSISRASSTAYLRSLTKINSPGEVAAEEDFSKRSHRLKRLFTEAIGELLDDVDSADQEIAAQALEYIGSS